LGGSALARTIVGCTNDLVGGWIYVYLFFELHTVLFTPLDFLYHFTPWISFFLFDRTTVLFHTHALYTSINHIVVVLVVVVISHSSCLYLLYIRTLSSSDDIWVSLGVKAVIENEKAVARLGQT